MRLAQRLSAGVLCLSLAAGAAGALTMYETGFESPTFSTGSINGQDGWTGSANIQSSVAYEGSQAVLIQGVQNARRMIDWTGNSDTVRIYDWYGRVDNEVTAGRTYQHYYGIYSNPSNYNYWTYLLFGNPGDDVSQRLYVIASYTPGGPSTGSVDTGITVTPDVWHHFRFEWNRVSMEIQWFYDGSRLLPGSTFYTIGRAENYNLGQWRSQDYGAPATAEFYTDKLFVVPEPSSALLMALGGAGVLGLIGLSGSRRVRRT